jgi:Tfp pilus assembly protein PilO
MRSIYQPHSPAALKARLASLESRVTSLLIQLADTRRERDALLSEISLLQSGRDLEGWRLP